jgi:uncharacterized protein YcfJ
MMKIVYALVASLMLAITGCTTAEQAGTVGAVGGGLVGAAIGGTEGALIGAVAGGVGGYLIGRTADGRCQYRTRDGRIVYDRCY